MKFNKIIPELSITNLENSLKFYKTLGFKIEYERPENKFAFLSLGDKTPYEIFTFIYGEALANKLNIQKIAKDEVCTTPRLLK